MLLVFQHDAVVTYLWPSEAQHATWIYFQVWTRSSQPDEPEKCIYISKPAANMHTTHTHVVKSVNGMARFVILRRNINWITTQLHHAKALRKSLRIFREIGYRPQHNHTFNNCVIYRYWVYSDIVNFRHQLPPYDPLTEPTHVADTLTRLHKPCIGLRTTFSQIHTGIYPHHLTFSSQFLTSHAYTSTPHGATRATFAPHMPCTCVRTLPEHWQINKHSRREIGSQTQHNHTFHTCVIHRYWLYSHIVHFRHQLPPYDPL